MDRERIGSCMNQLPDTVQRILAETALKKGPGVYPVEMILDRGADI